jgi:predicted ATPase
MAYRNNRDISLRPPYLKRIWLDADKISEPNSYPFNLPFFKNGFEWNFDTAITILVGENGVGKSTLLEGIAALAGYDDAGGGKGYRPVDHTLAVEVSGGKLAQALRAAWLPKVTQGWFFRAESFFSVARYLDDAAVSTGMAPPNVSSIFYEFYIKCRKPKKPKSSWRHTRQY